MKRKLLLFFLFILLAFSFTGCKGFEVGVNEQTASYSDRMAIPEDGIVSADVFKGLKETKQVVTFEGESKGIKYEWTVFGSEITEPKDCNLLVTIVKTSESAYIFNFASEEDFGFTPLLSIYSGDNNEGKVASLLEVRGNESAYLSDVYLTGTNSEILNVSYDSQVGTYIIEISDEEETLKMASADSNENESVNEPANEQKASSNSESKTESTTESKNDSEAYKPDEYLSKSTSSSSKVITGTGKSGESADTPAGRVLSDGSRTEKDQYLTDPVPIGKPQPVEPENQVINRGNALSCTFSIECTTILNNLENLDSDKLDVVPANGIIFPAQTVTFYEGESVYDVISRICSENNIHIEYEWTPAYNSAYIKGINNLYEFDCGSGSGWMYKVDGWYPNYGISRYVLSDGESVEFRYTCDYGSDIGGHYAMGE